MIALRDASPADQAFLRQLADERRLAEWTGAPIEPALLIPLLAQQFRAQQHGWAQAHPQSTEQIITLAATGEPLGHLWLDRSSSPWTLVDVGLLAHWQCRGIGTQCLQQVLAEATEAGAGVVLHVDRRNPARRLYERLGFVKQAEQPPHWRMAWAPPRAGASGPGQA